MESGGEEEATATPAAGASPATGRLKGSPELSLDADMRDVVKTAGRSVSSWKAVNGVAAFCDDNLDTDWSRGAVSLVEHPVLEGPCAGAELKLDESYTRSKMSVGAGDDFHNLKFLKKLMRKAVVDAITKTKTTAVPDFSEQPDWIGLI